MRSGLTTKKTAAALFLMLLGLVTYLSLTPSAHAISTYSWDKLNHAAAYACLGVLLDMAFRSGTKTEFKLLGLFGYSIGMELCQHFIPHRQFSYLDISANTAGLLAAWAVVLALKQTKLYRSLLD